MSCISCDDGTGEAVSTDVKGNNAVRCVGSVVWINDGSRDRVSHPSKDTQSARLGEGNGENVHHAKELDDFEVFERQEMVQEPSSP